MSAYCMCERSHLNNTHQIIIVNDTAFTHAVVLGGETEGISETYKFTLLPGESTQVHTFSTGNYLGITDADQESPYPRIFCFIENGPGMYMVSAIFKGTCQPRSRPLSNPRWLRQNVPPWSIRLDSEPSI